MGSSMDRAPKRYLGGNVHVALIVHELHIDSLVVSELLLVH